MDIKDFNKTLKESARSLGLCDKWYDEWEKKEPLQSLVQKYLKGIDFCIKHDYPSLDFLRNEVPKNVLTTNGIFLDDKVDESDITTAVFLGDCTGVLKYGFMNTGNVYVRHNSDVTIEAKDGARVFIETYENCKVNIISSGMSKVFVYYHGGEVTCSGDVSVRDKRKAGV